LKVIFKLGLDFRFDDRPEVDTGNHVAGVSRSRATKFSDAVFHDEFDETKIKYAHACA